MMSTRWVKARRHAPDVGHLPPYRSSRTVAVPDWAPPIGPQAPDRQPGGQARPRSWA